MHTAGPMTIDGRGAARVASDLASALTGRRANERLALAQ
jgi:hypothetical protein